jgi:multidrug efflux pump subunit AcrB
MAEFFVRRPIVAMVIAIITVIIGFVALGRLPIAQYPEITPPMVTVSATYTGASAINVEQSVATPIEQKVNGVEDMIYMRSINSSDGRLNLEVSFEVGTDLDMANVLTQNRVSEAQASLPEEVKRLGVTVKKKLSFPLLLISVISPQGTYDEEFLTNYATINIIDELARIRGVGLAEVLGSTVTEYAMRIWIKPDQLAKLGLTVPDITTAIQQQNVLVPAGQIGGAPAPPGTDFTYTVQTAGRFETSEEFGKVVVRSNPDGSQVLLRDVAEIELGTQNYLISARLDGAASALLQVFQLPDANGLEVARKVLEAMDRISERFPQDLEYVISLDTTKPITAGIREIVITLFQAVTLVILVVYIFLQSARATLIPTLTVPVSLIGTFAVFPLLGFSVNTLSLLGLVLAIGIVVDDAIVVVEAVSAKMEGGMSAHDATIEAMREVSGPIVATSLALIAVFVPVAAMGGITGRLYQQFAITIAISVALSSVNALTLSPALAALLLKPPGEQKSLFDKFFAAFNRALEKTTERFMVLTRYFTQRLVRAGALLAALVGGLISRSRLDRTLRRGSRGLRARGRPGLHPGNVPAAGRRLPAANRCGHEGRRADHWRGRCRTELDGHRGLQHRHGHDSAKCRHGLHPAQGLGRTSGQGRSRYRHRPPAECRLLYPHYGGCGVRLRPAGHPRSGNGIGLQHDAPGSRRKDTELSGRASTEVRRSRSKAARDRRHLYAVPTQRAPDLPGHRRSQGPQARGLARGPQYLHRGFSGRRLRQRLQPLRAALQGLRPGRARVPGRRGRHPHVLRA